MKFKKNKGFTLVELIIAMAISTILMLGIMTMSKPINDMAKVASDYDTKRTVANEINDFVCKNIKYATYADIYTGYNKLPDTSTSGIQKFMSDNGITNINDVRVIAIINDFNVVNTINANSLKPSYIVTLPDKKLCGRVFKSSKIDSPCNITYYIAMGHYYYGNNKYQFDFSYETEDNSGDVDKFNGVVTIKTITYDDGKESLTAKESSKFLNFDSSKFHVYKSSGKNTYIIYTKE